MTVGKMRRLMLKKIVPEKLLPQNIVDFLMDENAQPAELDAYTFFTRLRGLGLGSADFIYLLEGCGAPQEVVLKIKSNPAMNLQSLIRTVESANMTSKDYMRILYTARQIWERTLTSRIDLMESDMLTKPSLDEEPDDSVEDVEDKESSDIAQTSEFAAQFEALAQENASRSALDGTIDATMGFSLGKTEEFESLLGGKQASPDSAKQSEDFTAEIADSDEVIDEYLDEQNTITPASPEDLKRQTRDFTINIDYGADTGFEDLDNNDNSAEGSPVYAGAVDDIDDGDVLSENSLEYQTSPAQPAGGYNGDTTAIVKIDRAMLEENLARIANSAGAPDAELPEENEDNELSREDEGNDDSAGEKSRYYIGGLCVAAMGAVIVAGCGVAAGLLFGMEPPKPIGYAAGENEVFAAILQSHNEKIAGGDSFYRYGLQDLTAFGDLLVERDGLGTFIEGDSVYTFTYEQIAVNELSGGEIVSAGALTPPQNTVFADVEQLSDGSLIAAFDGECCGYMRVSGGQTLYTVRQDGSLTEFSVNDGEVRLGSVYTPKFYGVVNVSDKELYLPKLGVEYSPIEPQKVIISKTKGYSYGVAGAYSVESGITLRADAVMGNPVYASGDGVFALNSADAGVLLRVDYSNLENAENAENTENGAADSPAQPAVISLDCGKLVNAAFCEKGSAVFENGSIVIRDSEFNTLSMLRNFSSIPQVMRFSGDILLAADKDKVFLTVDCADLKAAYPVELKIVRGRVNGKAVILEQTAEGIRTASYKLSDGKAVLEYENTLPLTGDMRGTLEIGGAGVTVATEGACGAAYSYFDGVSVVSEFVLLGEAAKRLTLYDDRTGIDIAFADEAGGKVYVHYSQGLAEIGG